MLSTAATGIGRAWVPDISWQEAQPSGDQWGLMAGETRAGCVAAGRVVGD